MATSIFVNLPVRDLDRSKEFFEKLGYSANPEFSDENAACIVISDTIYAMLLTEQFFQGFTKKKIVDAADATEAIMCLSAESRQGVDTLVDNALAAGGSVANDTMEQDGMYGRSFYDLDGHHWEVMYMDQQA